MEIKQFCFRDLVIHHIHLVIKLLDIELYSFLVT